MTDLEMTKLSADAMGIKYEIENTGFRSFLRMTDYNDWPHDDQSEWNPLDDDSEAFALVKRFNLWIGGPVPGCTAWLVSHPNYHAAEASGRDDNLNRAIVETVARMQAAKGIGS